MSLRWRLMLSVGAVVLASVAAVAYISSRVVRVELNQLVAPSRADDLENRAAAARVVAEHYQRHGLTRMQSTLARIRDERFPRSEVMFLDRQGRVVAASEALEHGLQVRQDAGGVTTIRFGAGSSRSEIVVRGTPIAVVTAGEGPVGSLLLAPRWKGRLRDPMRAVNRWLLVAVAVVGAAALGFTALVARRVIAPIERLQEATARVRSGELEVSVPVRSRDEVGQLAEAFNAMTAALRQHEQLRRNMVNDVAHELRTPLTNLRASIEAIQDGLRAPAAPVIDALHDDVLLLQRLVEDLQTLALAEAGKLPLHIEDVDLREELERFARAQSEPRVNVKVGSEVRAAVDRVRLHQILSNLVRNALAHLSPPGQVDITAVPRDSSAVRLTVADDGAGIAAADLPHVFDRFYRADSSRTRTTGGAGLGLAIVRQLVEIQGGTVSVESEEGRGTRFTIDLPRRR